jgi:protein-S-isoprenylcysteine O-methyltransferase Ste14
MTDPQHAQFEKSFAKNIIQSSKTHVNLGQDIIVTTEDKVRLCMTHHAQRMSNKTAWIGPVSLLVTILLVLLTAVFHDTMGIPKDTWHAIFLLAAAATLIWSIVAIIKALRTSTSIDKIVDELKPSSNTGTPQA